MSSLEDAKRFIEQPEADIHHVYRALSLLAKENEEECGLRQYGHSKESHPNPIVQMGLFTDKDGIPLAFCINPGNTSETTTLKPLEDTLREKFGISKVITCTDGGLASYENRLNDHVGERAFITVQSLKKLAGHIQDNEKNHQRDKKYSEGPIY